MRAFRQEPYRDTSATSFAVLRVSILVANDKNTNAVIHGTVDDGVGKSMKRKPATLANRGSPKTWVCTQQHGDALELLDEPRCDGTPSSFR